MGNAIAQNRYGVFGQVVTTNPNSGNPLQFLGGMSDATTGLDYMGRSFYSPGLGLNVSGGDGLAMLDSIPAGGIGGGTASGGGRSYNCDGLAKAIGKGIDAAGTSLGGIAGGFAGGAGGAALGTALAGSTGGAGAALVPAFTVGGAALGTGLGAYTGHLIGAALGSGVTSLLQLILHQHCAMFTSGGSSGGGTPNPPRPGNVDFSSDTIQHILDRHGAGTPGGDSKFKPSFSNSGSVLDLIDEAVNGTPPDQWQYDPDRNNFQIPFSFPYTIGDQSSLAGGGATSSIKVIVGVDGTGVTAFPV